MQAAWVGETVVPASDEEVRAEGVTWETFPPADPGPTADRLAAARGFAQRADVKRVYASAKDESQVAKEGDEHTHVADEVRLVLEGQAVYDIRAKDGVRWLRLWVGPGDAVVIPQKAYHLMRVPEQTDLRYVEVFGSSAGLLPLYRVSGDSTRAV